MTLRSGLAGQIGFANETTWSVPNTVTRFVPHISESLMDERARLESAGVIAGARVLRAQQSDTGASTVGGDVQLELCDRSIGLLFTHMFGAVATTGSDPYEHTFTPGELSGKGLTVQVGRPGSSDGTVDPYTYTGMKVASWEIACSAGEIATLGLTFAGRHEIMHRTVTDGVTTVTSTAISSATAAFSQADVGKPISGTGIPAGATIASVESATAANISANASASGTGVTFTLGIALASASYAASIKPMSFISGSVTIGGSAYKTKELTIAGDNGLDVDRNFAGDASRDEPLEAALREYTGTIDSEYFSPAAYRRFLSGDAATVVVVLKRPGGSTCTITMNARFDGTTPNLDGTAVVQQSLPFKCLGTTTDAAAITAVLSAWPDATP